MKILIVDDEYDSRKMIMEAIRSKYPEVEITEAVNGAEAADKFAEGDFDIVVTDYGMPQMNGLELLKVIHGSAKVVSAVMISGFMKFQQLKAGAEALGFKFLPKPFQFKDLFRILAEFEKTGE